MGTRAVKTDFPHQGDHLLAAEGYGLSLVEFARSPASSKVDEELVSELRGHRVEIGLGENKFHWCGFSRRVGPCRTSSPGAGQRPRMDGGNDNFTLSTCSGVTW